MKNFVLGLLVIGVCAAACDVSRADVPARNGHGAWALRGEAYAETLAKRDQGIAAYNAASTIRASVNSRKAKTLTNISKITGHLYGIFISSIPSAQRASLSSAWILAQNEFTTRNTYLTVELIPINAYFGGTVSITNSEAWSAWMAAELSWDNYEAMLLYETAFIKFSELIPQAGTSECEYNSVFPSWQDLEEDTWAYFIAEMAAYLELGNEEP